MANQEIPTWKKLISDTSNAETKQLLTNAVESLAHQPEEGQTKLDLTLSLDDVKTVLQVVAEKDANAAHILKYLIKAYDLP